MQEAAICTCRLWIKLLIKLGFSLLCFQAEAVCPVCGMDEVIEARRDLWRVEHNLLLKAKHFWCPGTTWVPGKDLWCGRSCPGAVLHCHISLRIFSTSFQSESWFCQGLSPNPHFNLLLKICIYAHCKGDKCVDSLLQVFSIQNFLK